MTARMPVELTDAKNQRVGNKIVLVYPDNEPLRTDQEFNSLVFVELEHNRVHRGVTFRSWYVVPHDTPLANDAEINIVVTTTTKELHIVFAVAGGGDFEFFIYRSPDVGAGGAALPIHNLNDSSPMTSTVTVTLNPTINGDGTEIDGEFHPGGTGGTAVGGAIHSATEDNFRPNTSYLVKVVNRTGTAQQFGVELQWYEES